MVTLSVLAWTQAIEPSLRQPSTATPEISLTYVGGVLLGLALLWALTWIFGGARRRNDRLLKGQEPHFFWMNRRK